MSFLNGIESINEVKYNDIVEIAAKTSLAELTEDESKESSDRTNILHDSCIIIC